MILIHYNVIFITIQQRYIIMSQLCTYFLYQQVKSWSLIQVFGALWYFSAVAREMICWEHACSVSTTGCSRRSFYCSHENSIDNQWFFSVNDLCRDDLAFDFGIFKEAIQHQIVDVTSFVGKFPYCLRWGLQSLRFVV